MSLFKAGLAFVQNICWLRLLPVNTNSAQPFQVWWCCVTCHIQQVAALSYTSQVSQVTQQLYQRSCREEKMTVPESFDINSGCDFIDVLPSWMSPKQSDWAVRHPGERLRATRFHIDQLHIYFRLRQASTRRRPHYHLAAVDICASQRKRAAMIAHSVTATNVLHSICPRIRSVLTGGWDWKGDSLKTAVTVTAGYSSAIELMYALLLFSKLYCFSKLCFGILKHQIWGCTWKHSAIRNTRLNS